MRILKFGGSSLATPDRVRDVVRIVLTQARQEPVIVVVSAFQGITNQLIDAAHLAERGVRGYDRTYAQIAKRHHAAADNLVGSRIRPQVDALLSELHDALQGIRLLRHCSPRALDLVTSFGERLSALIMAAHLHRTRPARFVDAREFLITDDQFTHAQVNFSKTNRATRRYFAQLTRRRPARLIPVVTGFIGATSDGRTTTIGRNGSDYSAAIVGAAVGASATDIRTAVDAAVSAGRVGPDFDHR